MKTETLLEKLKEEGNKKLNKELDDWENECGKDIGRINLEDIVADLITSTVKAVIAEVEKEIEDMEKELPKKKCMNLENHLHGSCFQCEKIKGFNQALNEAQTTLKELLNDK